MLYAKFMYPDNGWDGDVKYAKEAGLEVGKKYEVEEVYMGQSNTTIFLNGLAGCFNSVQFEFEEDGIFIVIVKSPKYNPYMKEHMNYI